MSDPAAEVATSQSGPISGPSGGAGRGKRTGGKSAACGEKDERRREEGGRDGEGVGARKRNGERSSGGFGKRRTLL